MEYLKSISEAVKGRFLTIEYLGRNSDPAYPMSARDARNSEYKSSKDNRIVLYEIWNSKADGYVTISLAMVNDGEYLVVASDDKNNIYTYDMSEVYELYATWDEGYKFISEILKVLGVNKPIIHRP